jgi:hypothetical protein
MAEPHHPLQLFHDDDAKYARLYSRELNRSGTALQIGTKLTKTIHTSRHHHITHTLSPDHGRIPSANTRSHGGRTAWSDVMRLLLFTLAMPFLLQPAAAREHPRHYGWRHVSYHHAYYRHNARLRMRAEYAPPSYEAREGHGDLDAMIARHAQMEGVPEALVHRVVIRESRYNPRAIGAGGAMGLMQIKYSTARAMGYTGSPAGLLDADTNLTYAVRYLAGAYRVAHGSGDRAVMNYARGYYDGAKREGFSPYRTNALAGSYASAWPSERVAYNGTAVRRREAPAPGAFDRQLDVR